MVVSLLTEALASRPALVLDGAMATELERRGADLSGALWSARVLKEEPSLVRAVHRSYLDAGADVITTASYQASLEGFAAQGIASAEAERLIGLSQELALAERDDFWAGLDERRQGRTRPIVATSVGPYGAVLADGSEYRGDYDVSARDLVRFHRARLELLAQPGVEVLACETIPSLVEAKALVEALGSFPSLTAWVSFSARDGHHVSDGTAVAECAGFLQTAEQVVAVGVNCTALTHVESLVRDIAAASDKPVVVYPNSGETWDPDRRSWAKGPAGAGFDVPAGAGFGVLAARWHAAGARLIGGCCRTRPDDIQAVAAALDPLPG